MRVKAALQLCSNQFGNTACKKQHCLAARADSGGSVCVLIVKKAQLHILQKKSNGQKKTIQLLSCLVRTGKYQKYGPLYCNSLIHQSFKCQILLKSVGLIVRRPACVLVDNLHAPVSKTGQYVQRRELFGLCWSDGCHIRGGGGGAPGRWCGV